MEMATIKDVAKKAGVSISTVSIVINGKDKERKISQKTVQNVWNAIEELHYKPNKNALRLRSAPQSKTIVLFYNKEMDLTVLTAFIKGVSKQSLDIDLQIVGLNPQDLSKSLLLGKILEADCLICIGFDQKMIALLESFPIEVPLVLFNRQSDSFSSVCIDEESVLDLIHSHFSLNNRTACIYSKKDPFSGAIAEKMKTKYHCSLYPAVTFEPKEGYDACLLIPFSKVSHLVVTSFDLCCGVLKYCSQYQIQEIELLVLCDEEQSLLSYIAPNTRSIRIPYSKMAVGSLVLVQKLIEGAVKEDWIAAPLFLD